MRWNHVRRTRRVLIYDRDGTLGMFLSYRSGNRGADETTAACYKDVGERHGTFLLANDLWSLLFVTGAGV